MSTKGFRRVVITLLCAILLIPLIAAFAGCRPAPFTDDGQGTVAIEYAKGKMNLSWAAVEGAKMYEISRGRSRLANHTVINTVKKPVFTDNQTNFNKYENYYKIAPKDRDGNAIVVGLKWRPHGNAAKYDIFRGTDKIFSADKKIASVVIPEYYSATAAVGKAGDVFKIIPYNAAGERFMTGSGDNRTEVEITGESVEVLTHITASLEKTTFGENTLFYTPYDSVDKIEEEINFIHDNYMFTNPNTRETAGQFSFRRYQYYFKPGIYEFEPDEEGKADHLKIGYYTAISGLGALPTDTKINATIETPAPLARGNATCTFWRSTENFEINHAEGAKDTKFQWAVSQAAPSRRMSVNVPALFDWNDVFPSGQKTNGSDNAPWASGGFLSDSRFTSTLGSNNQQQWYSRNSHFGHSAYSGDNWNRVTQGVTGYPYTSDWDKGGRRTNVETTPEIREKPFLYFADGKYQVFVPSLKTNSSGISWNDETGDMGAGISLDFEEKFYSAKPGDSADIINAEIAAGKHIFFTPGWYALEKPIVVNRADTILLGSGYATLFPDAGNTEGAVFVDDVPGVTVASLMIDAHYDSKYLIRMGAWGADNDHSKNPSVLSDVFLRVGGYMTGSVNADVSVQINSNNVIGDHLWVWRGDHGNSIGWNANTSDYGLLVSGDDVTMYGLFVEHYQKYQTLWLGENGRTYFYQNELPYDPPYQSYGYSDAEYETINNTRTLVSYKDPIDPPQEGRWYSHNGTVNGWAAYKVGNDVKNHYAVGLGCYGVFNKQSNPAEGNPNKLPYYVVFLQNAVEVPNAAGVKIEHIVTTELGMRGGTTSIINGTGLPVGRSVAFPHTTSAPGGTGNAQARRVVTYQNGTSIIRAADGASSQTLLNALQPGDEDIAAMIAHLMI